MRPPRTLLQNRAAWTNEFKAGKLEKHQEGISAQKSKVRVLTSITQKLSGILFCFLSSAHTFPHYLWFASFMKEQQHKNIYIFSGSYHMGCILFKALTMPYGEPYEILLHKILHKTAYRESAGKQVSFVLLISPKSQQTSANFLLVHTLYSLKDFLYNSHHQASINHKSFKNKLFIHHAAALHTRLESYGIYNEETT